MSEARSEILPTESAGAGALPPLTHDEMAAAGWSAMARGEWTAAMDLWTILRECAPERPDGYVGGCHALRAIGQVAEADVLGAIGAARFATNPDVLIAHAWVAMARQDWNEADLRWRAVRQRFPERLDGYIGATQALRYAGRHSEAEAICAEALARFPQAAELLIEYAWLAMARWSWGEAVCRWQAARQHAPDRIEPWIWPISALRASSRLDEAEAMASEALARFPDNTVALGEQIKIALYRGDRDRAFRLMEAARDRLTAAGPLDTELSWLDYRLSLKKLGGDASQETEAIAAPGDVTVAGLPGNELMLSFESIGRNCDFGVVQRLHGAEPISLLRFANTPYGALIAALDARFDGIGLAEDAVCSHHNALEEYLVWSVRYGFTFHTHVYRKDFPTIDDGGKFLARHCQRLQFLKNKLIADLGAAEKILVYANFERLSDAEIERLHDALCQYGPNFLLCIRPAEPAHPDGTVEPLRRGLFVGYLGRFTDFHTNETPPVGSWRTICARTYELALQHGFVRPVTSAPNGGAA